ncbi:MAG: zf-HC2 domain-containing protein [Clostridium sp.]|nr:zf-HC2 domain-containing protein [Clostridium sp.]
MKCSEAERKVIPYIRDELGIDELSAFLRHVDSCPSCREELEIYYMVGVGLRQLESDSGAAFGASDIVGKLRRRLEESHRRVRRFFVLRVLSYVFETLGAMAALLAVLLQLRLWMFPVM